MKNLAQMQKISKQIAAMTEEQRIELSRKMGLMTNCEGKQLSLVNTMLILTAIPTASMVGGFQQWKKVGRQIIKGEQARAYIFIPCKKKNKNEGESDSVFFNTKAVWDISQTEEIQPESAND